jgi:hypothetical protein
VVFAGFGARPDETSDTGAFAVGFQPCSVGVQLGVAISHGLQLVEHDGDIPRHADLIGLGMVGFGARLLQLVAQVVALLDQSRLFGLHPLNQRLQKLFAEGACQPVLVRMLL